MIWDTAYGKLYVPRYSDAFGVDILGGDGLLQLL